MITYKPLWEYLKEKKISSYALIYTYGINSYAVSDYSLLG